MIGYKSFESFGVVWRNLSYGIAPLSPPSRVTLGELCHRRLSLLSGILYVRWESDFDSLSESNWWHIINDDPSSANISSFSSKVRNQIRRGNKRFMCRPVSREFIAEEGYSVYKAVSIAHAPTRNCLTNEEFILAICSMHESTEFWGVFSIETARMVGFSENYIEDKTCFYNTIWCKPAAMKDYCAYSLFYSMNKHYLLDRGFLYVSDGARSLSHSTNIQDFLISKFRFRKAYANLNVLYHPLLRYLLKLAYPLRKFFVCCGHPAMQKVSSLLKMEEIRLSCLQHVV